MLYDILDFTLWLIARTGCLIVGHRWGPLTDKRLCDICRRCGKLHAHFRSPNNCADCGRPLEYTREIDENGDNPAYICSCKERTHA